MKRVLYLLVFIAGIHASAYSQQLSTLDNLLSNNQQLIEDGVKDGFFVVRRYYKLQDTTKTEPTYYGWNNLPYFGFTYSLGIKIKSGYFMDDVAGRPWVYDARFEEYRNNARYAPVISESEYRIHNDTTYLKLLQNESLVSIISNEHLYFVKDTTFNNKGFAVDSLLGVKKGWLVWVITDKPLQEQPDQTLSLTIYRAELTFENDSVSYEVRNPTTDKSILGGIYIMPDNSEIGQITFLIAGILEKKDNQWVVIPVRKKSSLGQNAPGAVNANTNNNEVNELTPIPNNDSRNNSSRSSGRRRR